MAPPPPATMPLGERLVTLAKTLQFGWFSGHLVLLLCILRYSFSWIRFNYYSSMARFSYRLAFVSAAATYGIVVYKTLRARQRAGVKPSASSYIGLLSDENVQYLAMALVWLLSPQYPLAMLPYGIYSVFHVATYVRSNLIPTIFPTPAAGAAANGGMPAQHPVAEAIGNFVKEYYDASMSGVSALEILLWVRLLLSAVLFQRRSWILLALYTAFVRARFSQSTHTQNSFAKLEARVDGLVGQQGTHPAVRSGWEGVKNGARQFHQMTDVNRYASGAAAPKKTS